MSLLVRQLFKNLTICGSSLRAKVNTAVVPKLLNSQIQKYSQFSAAPQAHQEVVDTEQDNKVTKAILQKCHDQLKESSHGRLFAVVHIAGKQFKITQGDVLIIEGSWPPTTGDKINLNKVLMLGSTDFTLIGRPLVQPGLVDIQATVIEKTLSHTKTQFRKKRRKQYKRIQFYRIHQTMLRINKIEVVTELNNPPDVISVDRH